MSVKIRKKGNGNKNINICILTIGITKAHLKWCFLIISVQLLYLRSTQTVQKKSIWIGKLFDFCGILQTRLFGEFCLKLQEAFIIMPCVSGSCQALEVENVREDRDSQLNDLSDWSYSKRHWSRA